MSSVCELLKDHIDSLWAKHAMSYKDIAKVLNLNVSSVRSGIYNDRLGFDKFCKVAIVSGFPLMRYAGEVLTRYSKEVKDLEDVQARIKTYYEALDKKILVTYDNNEAYKEAFDEALRESTDDTASLVMLAKMRYTVDKKEDKGKNDTLMELTTLHGDIEEHIEEKTTQMEEEEKEMADKEKTLIVESVEPKPTLPKLNDVVRPIMADRKGMEAVMFYETFKALWNYGVSGDRAYLTECIDNAMGLMKETDINPAA